MENKPRTDDFTQAARHDIQPEQYRHLQAVATTELFKRANGREPASVGELGQWAAGQDHGSQSGKVDPFDLLTREQIESALADFENRRR